MHELPSSSHTHANSYSLSHSISLSPVSTHVSTHSRTHERTHTYTHTHTTNEHSHTRTHTTLDMYIQRMRESMSYTYWMAPELVRGQNYGDFGVNRGDMGSRSVRM